MIDETDVRLSQWVRSVVGDAVEIVLEPPSSDATAPTGPRVGLHLVDLADRSPAAGRPDAPMELHLRYLVTVTAADVAQSHRMLGELAFGAIEEPTLQVEPDPLPMQAWIAFGIPPRPGFLLRVPVQRFRTAPPREIKLVTEPLVLRSVQPGPLEGVVVGPGDRPIPGALVTIASIGRSTHSDAEGRFRFGSVPLEPRTKRIDVIAKGRRDRVTVDHPTPTAEPVRIRLDLAEED